MKKELLTYWDIIQSPTIKMAAIINLFVVITLAASLVLTSCSEKGHVWKSDTSKGCKNQKGIYGVN